MRVVWRNAGLVLAVVAIGGLAPQVAHLAGDTSTSGETAGGQASTAAPAVKTNNESKSAPSAKPAPKPPTTALGGHETLWRDYGATYYSHAPDVSSVKVLLALVPDPAASRLSAMFDAVVEGVQRAAEDAGYSYDRFWLPWDKDAAKAERAGEPGVIVFRRLPACPPDVAVCGGVRETLAIFLIGETPTSGIDAKAFRKAVMLATTWSSSAREELLIAGPCFSGSIPSLRVVLDDPKGAVKKLRIISGSATNAANPRRMAGAKNWSYAATVHDDDFAMNHFLDFLRDQEIEPDKVAVFSESGTAYGAGIRNPKAGKGSASPLSLPFPMEIGRLRNAYHSDPALRSALNGGGVDALPTGLGIKLTDPGRVTDRIPAYSPDVTAVGQELTLKNIADTVRKEGVGTVGVVATDILDSLFVTSLVRRYCPNVRTFLLDSDTLFQHDSSALSFYGTYLITTYPMFGLNQSWLAPQGASVTHFPNRNAQGAYNAARLLLGGQALDYANPFKPGSDAPPLWLTVVGHGGLWPLRLLSEERSPVLASSKSTEQFKRNLPPPSVLWYLMLAVACIPLVAPVHLGRDLTRCYTDLPLSDGWFYEFAANLACLVAILPLATVQHLYASRFSEGLWFDWVVAILAMSLAAGYLFRCLWALRGPNLKSRRSWILLLLAVGLAGAFGLYLGKWVALWLDKEPDSTIFFRLLRSLSPSNGVAPTLPVTALALGLFAWCRMQLRKLQIRHLCDPGWAGFSSQDARLTGLDAAVRETRASAEAFLPPAPIGAVISMIAFFLIAHVALVHSFRGLEDRSWDFYVFYTACLLAALVLLDVVRVLTLWVRLENCLFHLESHPMTNTLDQLTNQSPNLKPQDGFVLRETRWLYRNLSATLDRLLVLECHLTEETKHQTQVAIARIQEVFQCHAMRKKPCLADMQHLQGVLNAIANDLKADWNPSAIRPLDKAVREFRALRVAALIHYAYRQIWNRIGFLSLGFLMFLMALVTYPFQPHRTLSVLITVLMVGLGGTVLFLFVRFDRNAVLSRMNGSEPGKLGGNFVQWAVTYGALPLATFLLSQFPEYSRPLFSILDPALKALK